MAGPISAYWASVSIKTDEKALKDVDAYLKKIESRLSKTAGKKGLAVNLYIDEAKFHKHLQGVLNRAGKSSPFKLANVTIDPTKLVASVRSVFAQAQFKAPISATISRASLQTIRSQVQAALQGITIGVRTASVTQRGSSTSQGTGNVSAQRRASLTGRGDPSLQEFLMGKPDKSSLSAGNRRYLDAIVGKSFGGVGGNSLTGMAIQGGLGGLARIGGGSFLGRAAGMAGMALGGPFGGAMGLVGSGILSMAGSAFTGIWSTLGKVITLPFQAISSAASMVTGAFYKVALAAVPLVAGFGYINKFVQKESQQQIALNTVSKSLGSSGNTEQKWLMNMANRDGMRYGTLIEPYTSFIASASPAMGLGMAKNVFEAFTQFGLTRGAGDVSMGLAMKAVSQMAGKGKIQAEELRGQLGDAPGFGEMQGIFAEAYQRSLGRTSSEAKKGQKAIEELNDAMKKGNVLSEKVLPFVAEIAKQMAAGGIQEARLSSFAQQNRFMNQLRTGRDNFRTGGGETGIAFFWQIMQRMGNWWISNSSALGRAFETTMYWLDAFRLGIYEFYQFVSTGKENSFTDWLKGLGLDVDLIYLAFKDLKAAIMQLLGLDSNSASNNIKIIGERLVTFVNNLAYIVRSVEQVINGLNQIKVGVVTNQQKYGEGTTFADRTRNALSDVGSNLMKFTPFRNFFNYDSSISGGIGTILRGITGGTAEAAGSLKNLAVGGGQYALPISPKPADWKPEGWGANPADISQGMTRRSDYEPPKTLNHVVKIEVTGNAEAISALMDDRSKAQFPILFSKELTKALVQAPKQ